jgi:hypothetical protein
MGAGDGMIPGQAARIAEKLLGESEGERQQAITRARKRGDRGLGLPRGYGDPRLG